MSSTVVPELLAKKQKRDEQWAAEKAAAAVEARKKARATRKDIFKRAESYVKEYVQQVRPSTAAGEPPSPRCAAHAAGPPQPEPASLCWAALCMRGDAG
jgi:hypothetical protein